MRRRLAPLAPALKLHFDLAWSDVEELPQYELDEYIAAIEAIAEANARNQGGEP